MRIRTVTGLTVAGAAAVAAVIGGVAYATAEDSSGEPIVRIVTDDEPAVGNAVQQEQQPQEDTREDCPQDGAEDGSAEPSTAGTGL